MLIQNSNIFKINFKGSNDVATSLVTGQQPEKQDVQCNCNECMASYNKSLVTQLPDITSVKFDDNTLEEAFGVGTGISYPGTYFDANLIRNMTSESVWEPIVHFEQTGEIIPWKRERIREDLKHKGFYGENLEQEFQKKEAEYGKSIKEDLQKCTDEFDKLVPTAKDAIAYRTIDRGYKDLSKKYFDNIIRAQVGEQIKLNPCPIYIGTNGNKIAETYGGKNNAVMFKINIPAGSKVLKYPDFGIEQAIMKPGAQFKVVDKQEFKNNNHLIELEYISE